MSQPFESLQKMPIMKLCFAIYTAPAKGDFVSKSLKGTTGLPQSALMLHQWICVEMSNRILPEFLVEISAERLIQIVHLLVGRDHGPVHASARKREVGNWRQRGHGGGLHLSS